MPKQIKDQDVYDATLAVLLEKGYDGATTKLIARAAGINEVTLFRKYGTKAQLVAESISHTALLFEDAELAYTGEIEVDLYRMATIYYSRAAIHGRLFPMIMSEMSRYAELRPILSGPMYVIGRIEAVISRYQTEGRLCIEHTKHAVAALLGPIIILSMLAEANPELGVPPLDVRAHVKSFIRGRQPS